MRKLLILLAPALIVLLGLGAGRHLMSETAPAAPVAPTDGAVADVAPPAGPVVGLPPGGGSTECAAAAPAPAAVAEGTPVDPVAARASEILAELRDYARAGLAAVPESAIREAGDLVNRDPAAADRFAGALPDADEKLRTYLRCVFFTVNDSRLRTRLLKIHYETDPTRVRLARVFEDKARLLAALANDDDPDFRIRVVDSVSAEILADPEIAAGLFRLADDAPETKTRTRAAYRLSRVDDEAVRRRVIAMLEDASRPLEQRQAIAMGLGRCRSPELRDTFLRILERGDTEAVLIHALGGLADWVAEPGVQETLLAELARPTNPLGVRKQAAASLVDGWASLDERSREALSSRLRGIVRDLDSRNDPAILVHLIGPLCRNGEEGGAGEIQAVESEAPAGADPAGVVSRADRESR